MVAEDGPKAGCGVVVGGTWNSVAGDRPCSIRWRGRGIAVAETLGRRTMGRGVGVLRGIDGWRETDGRRAIGGSRGIGIGGT